MEKLVIQYLIIPYFLPLQTWHVEQHQFSFFNLGNQAILHGLQITKLDHLHWFPNFVTPPSFFVSLVA